MCFFYSKKVSKLVPEKYSCKSSKLFLRYVGTKCTVENCPCKSQIWVKTPICEDKNHTNLILNPKRSKACYGKDINQLATPSSIWLMLTIIARIHDWWPSVGSFSASRGKQHTHIREFKTSQRQKHVISAKGDTYTDIRTSWVTTRL